MFRVHSGTATRDVVAAISHAVVAGWTGRDAAAVEKHIAELEAIGVARPSSIPTFYRVSANRVVTDSAIDVLGEESSGEVECVFLQSAGRLFVGVGSDHTDRRVEAYCVSASKQICDKPMAADLWEFAELADHWDRLVLRSWIFEHDTRVPYQEGTVAAMRPPADLIARYAGTPELPDGTVMFGGTLPVRGGVRPSRRFEFELEDPVLQRRIRHGYDVITLPLA